MAEGVAAIRPEYEIVGPDGETERRDTVGSAGVEIATAYRDGALVYELEIPFAEIAGGDSSATLRPGQVIGVGVETGQGHPGGKGGPGGGMGPPGTG